ncbi:hypothetical protein AA106555_1634 [Neokomagataea thailandica NBRC 106555]|uniref:Uncharacterized protein n=1 Tax=Neokomagataea thailandica NBRC 106555 TaxID=1223520 RepID=A0ABQ0QRL0_9PROT|nr:hypothetical protein AA106555_1634 [Neokomagataea thailandica NBRC 106555]
MHVVQKQSTAPSPEMFYETGDNMRVPRLGISDGAIQCEPANSRVICKEAIQAEVKVAA